MRVSKIEKPSYGEQFHLDLSAAKLMTLCTARHRLTNVVFVVMLIERFPQLRETPKQTCYAEI